MKKSNGFTLIELMIVVAVIGLLAAIAIPSYQDSVRKGRRAEGRAALTELLQQQERYMTQMNSYLAFTNSAGTTTPVSAATTFKVFSGDSLAKAAYLLSADACPSAVITECVRLTATPVVADAEAGNLQILSSGTKTCTGTTTSVCWK